MTPQSRKDPLWVIATSTLILAWGSIPTWAGYQYETSDLRFRGIYFDSQDYAAHIAMMEAGRNGEWAYQFRFTSESFDLAYTRIFYIILGQFSRLFGSNPEAFFEIARWLLGYLALYALYRLTRQIFPDIFWARTAFLLGIMGSGIGWLQLAFDWAPGSITPIDFWLIDGYVFYSLSIFPHFAFVTAATCITLGLWLDYLERRNVWKVIWIIFIAILVQFTNPIAFATVDAALFGAALFTWWKKKRINITEFSALSIIAIFQIPLLLYNTHILNLDSHWSQYTSQHQTLSPPPIYYVLGFAMFWLPAIWGMVTSFRTKSAHLGASILWLLVAFSLAYSPLYTQRRFLQNITIPLAILAAEGLMRLFEASPASSSSVKRWRAGIIIVFVFVASLSSIQLSLGRALYLQTHPKDLYYPSSIDAAVAWLRDNAHYNDFVLAAEQTSQVLAQKAGVRVYFGHEMETLHYEEKRELIIKFFEGKMDELASPPIQWVVYGPNERAISPDFQPGKNLELVFDKQELKIYKVK
jgi:hypothetical protein